MDFSYIFHTFLLSLKGVPVTLVIMIVSILLSFLPALFLALGRIYKVKGVTIFKLNPIYYAFIIFSLMTTGSLSEILRSAILTVDKGQLEAAQSIGLTTTQSYLRIIFPQALRSALPNLCNLVINIVKGTSLVFVMTVKDITAIAKVEAAHGYQYFESYLVIFIIYIIICGLIQWSFSTLEKRFA